MSPVCIVGACAFFPVGVFVGWVVNKDACSMGVSEMGA